MPRQTSQLSNSRLWFGEVGIDVGFAFFIGQTGDNQAHAHWVHQCIVRLDQPYTLFSAGLSFQSDAIFVPAGVEHRLIAPRHLSLFFDPTTTLAKALCDHLEEPRAVQALPQKIADFFRGLLALENSGKNFHQHCQDFFKHHHKASKSDPRLPIILRSIRQETSADSAKLSKLAQQIALSESRFSHWFREQTGMPLRSYRKWLRLIVALEAILDGSNAINAAHAAGFSDQAHFSRTFLAMFGVTPHSLLPHLIRRK
ncbi:helix-turn-helix transcriptional regulator [Undibacterium sp. Di24W]|uniref:helix-turn-helix transcriptional regulator n=1 Tax=Undibacterium sp. Di24W TaxID=3413033 RepID=UPI003BF1D2AD